MLSILDCNNFWSPSGGGVRRYHLQKLDYFRKHPAIHYVFLMPDNHRRTEALDAHTVIEHVPAFKAPGNWEYRFVLKSRLLREVIEKHRPDVIEIGSPYIMPFMVRRALRGLSWQPKVVGFWHADFPVTYVGRFFARFGNFAGKLFESLAWSYARLHYNRMHGIFVPSRFILERMRERGMRNLQYVPLGVDTESFSPQRRSEARVRELKAGLPERLTIFFGHRFMEEKGLRTFLKAYPELCRRLGHEPAVVFAGTGPDLELVEQAAIKHAHVRYIGFVRDPKDMAVWYASCEMGLALSGWETFGLSILEAMASGQVLVGANLGAAREHIEKSGAGIVIPVSDAEALVEAIVKLYHSSDKAEKSRLAMEYSQGLTWDNCFSHEVDLYHEITGKPAAA